VPLFVDRARAIWLLLFEKVVKAAMRVPSWRRLDLGYVPLVPDVMSTGNPDREG
jgi:hypothetical protein